MTLFVKAPKRRAEEIKKLLVGYGLMLNEYKYQKDDENIFFPVSRRPPGHFELSVVERKAEIRKRMLTWKEAASKLLSFEELSIGRFSYDTLGDVAVVEVAHGLEHKEKELAELLIKTNRRIRTVLKKVGGHEGTFRTQKMKFLAGKRTKVAEVRENNARFLVDLENTYYSIRLGAERTRIMRLIKPGESVLCMFSGVGPYPIVFSRNTGAKRIVGVELNPVAHEYALKNRALNKAENNVELILGDVKDIVPSLKEKFDRITMPLPHTGEEFLPIALRSVKSGGVIHYYCFVRKEVITREMSRIEKLVLENGMAARSIVPVVCGQFSPGKYRVCYDIEIFADKTSND